VLTLFDKAKGATPQPKISLKKEFRQLLPKI